MNRQAASDTCANRRAPIAKLSISSISLIVLRTYNG